MKRKCSNCYHFKNKFEVLNSSYSCMELGTNPEDAPCGDYTRDGSQQDTSIDFVFSQVKQELNKDYKNPADKFFDISQTENLFNIVTDIFKMEQDVSLVIEKVRSEIERQGYQLPFDAAKINMFSDKLTDLYLLYRMTLAMGMGNYVDDIMKLRIDRHFADTRKYGQNPVFRRNIDYKSEVE